MAIRSDEITSIIKSAIDQFDAGAETRSVGTVVEVGDGIAQIYGLDGALAQRAARVPGRRHRHGPEPRGGDGRRGHPRRRRRRSRKATPSRRPAASSRCPVGQALLGRVVDPLGRPLDDKGPIATTATPPGRADRPRRHRPPVGRHAGPDRHQGDRRADPDRPRPARADHRRPPDGQDRDRDRHDHQPEGQGPRLHLRRDRPEAVDGRPDRRDAREVRRDGAHDRRRRRRRGSRAAPVPRPVRRRRDGRGGHGERRRGRRAGPGQGRAVRLRRPDQARLGLPRDVAAAPPPARPRGVPRRRLLPPLAGCSSGPRG